MASNVAILTGADIARLDLSTEDILDAAQRGLMAQVDGRAIAEPTTTFRPLPDRDSTLSFIRGADIGQQLAMIKTVGTYPSNPAIGLPSNPGMAMLCDARTGQVIALIDAAPLTTLRTAAVAAIGAELAARPDSRILGCIGTRGIALQAATMIAELFALTEIRLHARDLTRAEKAATHLRGVSSAAVTVCGDWDSCLTGADILIDGASLPSDQDLFPLNSLAPGVTLLAYGGYASAHAQAANRFDRVVMDRWADGTSGAFGPSVAAGLLSRSDVSAYLGDVLAGRSTARTAPEQCILVWQRGLAACDITLAQVMITRADALGNLQTIDL